MNNTGAAYVSFNETHKNALDKIISEIGEEGWGWAVSTIFEEKDYTAENISNNAKNGRINISEEKKNKIQGIIDGLNLTNKKFGTLKIISATN